MDQNHRNMAVSLLCLMAKTTKKRVKVKGHIEQLSVTLRERSCRPRNGAPKEEKTEENR